VIHVDAHTVAVDWPGSPPTDMDDAVPTMLGAVRRALKRAGHSVRGLWTTQRFDTAFSGVVLLARTPQAKDELRRQFATRRTRSWYVVAVEGRRPARHIGSCERANHPTDRDERSNDDRTDPGRAGDDPRGDDRGRMLTLPPSPDGRGMTHYRLLEAGPLRCLLGVRPSGSDPWRMLADLRRAGMPVVGDARGQGPPLRLAAFRQSLRFTSPGDGQSIQLQCPVPDWIRRLVTAGQPRHPRNRTEGVPDQGRREPTCGEPRPTEPDRSDRTETEPTDETRPVRSEGIEAPRREETETQRGDDSWDEVAQWYDRLLEDRGSDLYERVIIPGTLRLLGSIRDRTVLDVACGQGFLCRTMSGLGARVVGVDASPRLLEAARTRGTDDRIGYVLGDVRRMDELDLPRADAITCVMALMNIDPIEPVLEGCAARLGGGGALVCVILHPAFRAPGSTRWLWETDPDGTPRQVRCVRAYRSPGSRAIVMNPGGVARGEKPVVTVTHHRPIEAYVRACVSAGLMIDAIEEWPSDRRSTSGPRADEENRAREEIPMFLAFRARRLPAGVSPGQ